MKKLYLALCMVVTIVAMTACGTETKTTTSFDENTVITQVQTLLDNWTKADFSTIMSDEGFQTYSDSYGEEQALETKTWEETKREVGASGDGVDTTTVSYTIKDTEVSYVDDTAVVTVTAEYPKETLIFKVVVDKNLNSTSISLDIYKTLGEKVIRALLNTVMGMTIVFVVLIFISLIIGFLKYVPKMLERNQKTPEMAVNNTPVAESTVEEEEELVDDTELVAVITAAIMASMGDEAPADGLVVRSIRRVNKKWKNA